MSKQTNYNSKEISILGWRHSYMDKEITQIEDLAFMLSNKRYKIYTGAGGGFMYSANKGAFNADTTCSYGYSVDIFDDEVDKTVFEPQNLISVNGTHNLSSYFLRKHLLITKDILIFCPGGMGTLDEFTEAITMKKIGLINPIIICFHKDFWLSFKKGATSSHPKMTFPDDCINLITDNIIEIYDFINANYKDTDVQT